MSTAGQGSPLLAAMVCGLLRFAALSGALAVMFGAFGAHILEGRLTLEAMEVYRTAVAYQFIHTLAILLIMALAGRFLTTRSAVLAAGLMAIGMVLFSGSLYLIVLGDIGGIGMLTPLGGLAFVGGWLALALGIASRDDHAATPTD